MSGRVLVIDDMPDVLILATLSLEASGFVALTAHDGLEGVELASESWPDLILCDVHMPRLDGFGVLSALRANAATAEIPLIFVTGDQSIPERVSQLTMQPDGCLTKPFTHADLMKTVSTTLLSSEDEPF
jgi:CheY-like chemotaxis protein